MSRFLDPDEMEAALARITYRPGWRIQLLVQDVDALGPRVKGTLRITFEAQDAYAPERQTKVGAMRPLPTMPLDDRAFVRFVFGALEEVERHECREWFRVDGVMVYDPHKEERGGVRA